MFCRMIGYLKMEKIQYKVLKIVFNSNESFEDLILQSNKVSIYQKQLCQLTIKICKILTDLSLKIIKPFSTIKEIPYSLRNEHIINLPSARTSYYRTNSILFRACQVSNNLPLSQKQSQSFFEFKTNKKALRNVKSLCKICKRS